MDERMSIEEQMAAWKSSLPDTSGEVDGIGKYNGAPNGTEGCYSNIEGDCQLYPCGEGNSRSELTALLWWKRTLEKRLTSSLPVEESLAKVNKAILSMSLSAEHLGFDSQRQILLCLREYALGHHGQKDDPYVKNIDARLNTLREQEDVVRDRKRETHDRLDDSMKQP